MSTEVAALVDFVTVPQWVAWRNEMRNGQLTKVPYCSATRQAEADDTSTWLPHDQAVLIADAVVNGSGGGIGIELGHCGDVWIAGVDLDTCRDPVTGIIEPWAATVIERLNSYAEVSPSQSGVKQFFLVDPADLPALRRIMGTPHGRQFKRANGSSHPPSIELYLSHRYFAVTWEGLPEAPADLRVVPLEDLRWLIEEAGPAFSGKRDSANGSAATNDTSASILDRLDIATKHSKPLAAALLHASTMRGGSRSEGAFGLGAALKRAGWTFEDIKAALRACPATKEWAGEADDRQFERAWARSDDQTTGERHTGQPKDEAKANGSAHPGTRPEDVPGIPFHTFSDIQHAAEVVDFIEDLLVMGAMSIIYGQSNCGKTFWVQDLVKHVIAGIPWRGQAVDRGAVLYLALEGGRQAFNNRIFALKQEMGWEGHDLPLAFITVPINLLNPDADVQPLIDTVTVVAKRFAEADCPVRWIVIDTLSRALAGGNENSSDDMGSLVLNMDRLRAATSAHVSGVHHSGKDEARGARGHSLLLGATDTEIEIIERQGTRTVTVTKQRDLPTLEPFAFKLKQVEIGTNRRGKPITTCLVEYRGNTNQAGQGTKRTNPCPTRVGNTSGPVRQ